MSGKATNQELSQFECGGQVQKSNKIATVFDLGSRLTFTSSLDTSEGKIVRFTLKNSSSLVLSKTCPDFGSDSVNFSRVNSCYCIHAQKFNASDTILDLLINLKHHVDGFVGLINLKLRLRGHIHVALSPKGYCEIFQ